MLSSVTEKSLFDVKFSFTSEVQKCMWRGHIHIWTTLLSVSIVDDLVNIDGEVKMCLTVQKFCTSYQGGSLWPTPVCLGMGLMGSPEQTQISHSSRVVVGFLKYKYETQLTSTLLSPVTYIDYNLVIKWDSRMSVTRRATIVDSNSKPLMIILWKMFVRQKQPLGTRPLAIQLLWLY